MMPGWVVPNVAEYHDHDDGTVTVTYRQAGSKTGYSVDYPDKRTASVESTLVMFPGTSRLAGEDAREEHPMMVRDLTTGDTLTIGGETLTVDKAWPAATQPGYHAISFQERTGLFRLPSDAEV